MMIGNVTRLAMLAGLIALAGCAREAGGGRAGECLVVEDGWVRAPLAGQATTAAYGRMVNRCAVPVRLAPLASPQAGWVGLHRTELVDGVSRMREDEGLEVPARGVLLLEPGGRHLMLGGLRGPLAGGGALTLVIGPAGDDALTVLLPVRPGPGPRHSP